MLNTKRKNLVVEPAIQYALVKQLLLQWSLHLVASLILLTMLQVLMGGLFRPWQYHWEQLLPIAASITISMLCMLPVFIRSSLKLSNRFVGPIHRFRNEMKRIATEEAYRPMSFRQDDFWSGLSDDIDAAVSSLQRHKVESPAEQSGPRADASTGVVLPEFDGPIDTSQSTNS